MGKEQSNPLDGLPAVSWDDPLEDVRRAAERAREFGTPVGEATPRSKRLTLIVERCRTGDELAYSMLSLRLDELIASGDGDTEEADRVRDRMDGPWHRMGYEGQQRMRELSVELDRMER